MAEHEVEIRPTRDLNQKYRVEFSGSITGQEETETFSLTPDLKFGNVAQGSVSLSGSGFQRDIWFGTGNIVVKNLETADNAELEVIIDGIRQFVAPNEGLEFDEDFSDVNRLTPGSFPFISPSMATDVDITFSGSRQANDVHVRYLAANELDDRLIDIKIVATLVDVDTGNVVEGSTQSIEHLGIDLGANGRFSWTVDLNQEEQRDFRVCVEAVEVDQ